MKEEYPNKIEERDIEVDFIPSKLSGEEYTYRHDNDCVMQGCPSHKAKMKYHSVTSTFSMDFGDGTRVHLDSTQMKIVYDWILRLKI
jgi:hypothetical protein